MTDHDTVLARIQEIVATGGERAEVRRRFAALWEEITPAGDALQRCVLAHHMADVQDDPREELAWDLRALEAAGALSDERLRAYHPTLSLRGFLPSLHLNLAEDYRKIGDVAQARAHLAQAQAAVDALADDGLGQFLRMGIARLADRLAEGKT